MDKIIKVGCVLVATLAIAVVFLTIGFETVASLIIYFDLILLLYFCFLFIVLVFNDDDDY